MKLNICSDYAIRIVFSLSNTDECKTMPSLSEELLVPYNHLTKIVQTLSKAGIVQTKQGKFGGVFLAKSPESISFKEVITLMEGPIKLSDCITNSSFCKLKSSCKIQGVFGKLQRQINELFENVNFSDLNQSKIEQIKEVEVV
ncbi:Rrf2 family transcriptional regulator [bacterium]|jgi:Rrf2 family transcriptional regulator, nitric oxide-sensitive transcriptional repressor|nr:Rrf2 family transcriptional regulator [bacterium]